MEAVLVLPHKHLRIGPTLDIVRGVDEVFLVCDCGQVLMLDYLDVPDMDKQFADFHDEHGECTRVKEQAA